MADYQLIISRQASKEFEALPAAMFERVRKKIRSLAATPRPPGSKKLRDSRTTWRIRIGDWRVLYEIDDTRKVVDVAAIRYRSNATLERYSCTSAIATSVVTTARLGHFSKSGCYETVGGSAGKDDFAPLL